MPSNWTAPLCGGLLSASRGSDSFNGKPKASARPAHADAFGLPLNDLPPMGYNNQSPRSGAVQLRTLYLQFRRSLLMSEQGGARSRVDTIRRISSRLIESAADTFQVEHCWRLTGTVEHWGHIHTRENEYTARIVVTAINGHWKIARVSFTDQKRVRFQTELRGLASGL